MASKRSSSVSPPPEWKEVVLPMSYINPDRLKTYLDAKFGEHETDYRVRAIGDQYYIDTKDGLDQEQLFDIKNLKVALKNVKSRPSTAADNGKGEGTPSTPRTNPANPTNSTSPPKPARSVTWKKIRSMITG